MFVRDWVTDTGLSFCPPHVALIVNKLLKHKACSDLFLSLEAAIAIAAIIEILCWELLLAARETCSAESDINYIVPRNVQIAMSRTFHPCKIRNNQKGCTLAEELFHIFQGFILLPCSTTLGPQPSTHSNHTYDTNKHDLTIDIKDSLPVEYLNILKTISSNSPAGVFVSPLTGNYLQVKVSEILCDSCSF